MPSEIFAVTVSVKLWASLLPHQWILVPTDNKRTDLLSTSKNHVFLSQACPSIQSLASHIDLASATEAQHLLSSTGYQQSLKWKATGGWIHISCSC